MAGWDAAAYQAAKAAGATDAQAAQYAGSAPQYANDPSEATSIVPGEQYGAAIARERSQGLSLGDASNFPASQQAAVTASAPADPAAGGTALGGNDVSPEYLSQLFPGGIPQTSTAKAAPSESTDGIVKSIMGALQPQFQQQDRGLTEALANAGIVGGSTTGAVAALDRQQQTQAQSDAAPYIMQGITQTNQTNQFNASNDNASNQFDIANLIKAAMGDQQTFNQFLAQNQQFGNQDWLAQLGAQANLSGAAAGGQASSYQPIYQQPAPVNFGGLGASLAPTPTTRSAAPASPPSPVLAA